MKTRLGHWPQFDAATIKAVADVLHSGRVNYWTGPKGMEFEKQFARWMGSRFAVSTTNGTSALHVALAGLWASARATRSGPLPEGGAQRNPEARDLRTLRGMGLIWDGTQRVPGS